MSRIKSATIVVLQAPSSGSLAKSTAEEYRDFEEVSMESEIDSSDMSKASQKAFFEELSKRALEAADRSDKVVVRYATNSSRHCQDSLVSRLIAGGASEENITVVRLSIDQGTKTLQNRSFYRTNYCTWRPKTVLA